MAQEFIPCTMEREISKNIVFRPVKSWHSNTYAGEKLEKLPGTNDGSGCMDKVFLRGFEIEMCTIPKSVTHRLYWHKKHPEFTISAFLSYPNGMASASQYFWEIYPYKDDIERFFGEDAEKQMEKVVVKSLNSKFGKNK